MKETLIGLGILVTTYVLLCASFLGAPEEVGMLAILGILFASGALTTRITGKKGIKGNGIAFAMMIVCYVIFASQTEPLWVIGLFTLPALHVALAIGWLVGLAWRQNKTDQDDADNPCNPPRYSKNQLDD